MEQRFAKVTSLVAETRASFYSDDDAKKGKVSIAASKPANVHFSALSPTDDLLALMASDGTKFTSFERGGTTCYVGKSCPDNIARVLPLYLEGADVVRVLMAVAPRFTAAEQHVAWDAVRGAYHLRRMAPSGGWVQHVWVAHGTGVVRRVELRRDDELSYALEYDDVDAVGGFLIPRTLRLKMDHRRIDMKLVYRDVEIDYPLKPSTFSIACPTGVTVEKLPCRGR